MTRSMRYQPILHTLYYTLHTEHAYCLSYRFLNNVVITTVIEMVEMDEILEILDGELGKHSVERIRYVINNLLHLVIVKYGVISLVLCISTRLRLMTILSLLVKYLVIFHADPCNKSYISRWNKTKCPEYKRCPFFRESTFRGSTVYTVSLYKSKLSRQNRILLNSLHLALSTNTRLFG